MTEAKQSSTGGLLGYLQQREGAIEFAEGAMRLLREIYPICRSITGDGVRQTIDLLGRYVAVDRFEVPTGTKVFDWEVPLEWKVRQAYICDSTGIRVVDFERHALHLLSYSEPVRKRMSLEELRPHLFSLPEHPDWIPYRTSYWRRTWGFCISQHQLDALTDGYYDVVIDSSLSDGNLTYAECTIPGEIEQEFLVFTHICHPALANDNASGLAVATLLGAALSKETPRLSYRFVFAPATIGSITWLALNENRVRSIRGGLVVGLLGDPAPLTYKRSRRGSTEIDLLASAIVRALDPLARVIDFSPYGYDERQFCSPGFNLPVGRLTRSSNGEYAEYHTSADGPELIQVDALAESVMALSKIIDCVDSNHRLRRLNPNCEPRLGKYGLFRSTGGQAPKDLEYAMLCVLNQSDGEHGVNDIAAGTGLALSVVLEAVNQLLDAGLIEDADEGHLPTV